MLLEKRIPFRYFYNQIRYDILFVFLMSVATFILKKMYGAQMPYIPVALPAFLGTAISLLLSFKLSQSYERWWEARIVWGAIVNDSRNIVNQILHFSTYNTADDGLNIRRRICYRQIAWAHCLGQSLRKINAVKKTEDFISAKDKAYIEQHSNKPLALLDLHSRDIAELYKNGQINSYQQVQLNQSVVELCNSMGRAERIRNTIFPVTYRQILHFFIYVFLFIMSVALLEIDSLWEIPLDLLIALPFFLIEKTATYMQDPFMNKPTDTSVTALANTIETNIKQILKDKSIPKTVILENDYYVM